MSDELFGFGAYFAVVVCLGLFGIAFFTIARWRQYWSGQVWETKKAQKVLRAAEALGPFWVRAVKSMAPVAGPAGWIVLGTLLTALLISEQTSVEVDHPLMRVSAYFFLFTLGLFISIVVFNRPRALIPPVARGPVVPEK